MSVHVTEAAAREIDAIICQQELDPATVCLRVGVKGGGCSGFSYLLDLTEVQKDSDELWEFTYTRKTATAESGEGCGRSWGNHHRCRWGGPFHLARHLRSEVLPLPERNRNRFQG